jgi:glycine cleavage system aminomethyltransferase T
MSNFIDEYRAIWRSQVDDAEKPLGIDRRPLFSPAASAQEAANSSRLWRRWANTWLPWQFGDWISEATAVHNTAFMGDWSALSKVLVKGPAAVDFLHHIGVADLTNFAVGRLRHFVCTNEDGKVATEGVLGRLSEDSYFYTGGGGEWLVYHFSQSAWDAAIELVTPDYFMFELQGPNSFKIVEAVCEQSIQLLDFNHWMPNKIQGASVRILRTGVSGELGYEVHGSSEYGAMVWNEFVKQGEQFGIVPLGARSQVLAHVEAGIATVGFDYIPATLGSPVKSQTSVAGPGQKIAGTYEFSSFKDLYRSPFELNWCSPNVVRRREFIGSDALRAEIDAGGPRRKLFGLVWNTDDVMSVYRTLFEDGPIAAQMDLPRHYMAEYYAVLAHGKSCGVATSRVYSPTLRRMISLAVIDRTVAQERPVATVLWGQDAKQAKEIRAEIVDLPFTTDRRRQTVI